MAVIKERQVIGGNGRDPSGQEVRRAWALLATAALYIPFDCFRG